MSAGDNLLVAPGYGSAFIADDKGYRRIATIDDLRNMVLLAGSSAEIDVTGGLLVEPSDVAVNLRPLEISKVLVKYSDKPFMGSVSGHVGARESLEMAKIVFGDIKNKSCVMGLININSPLRLDSHMAGAMVEYAAANQPVVFTPGILMGITAPVTVVGAMVQAYAELLGCAAAAQVLKPGLPIILGIGGFGSDLRSGGTGFGRPENALGIQIGAEISRRLEIPFRCSAAVTGSRVPDCRSGYERMMTAMTAYNAGAHFCLQAAGILDSINMMSYEQYIIDLEIWSYIKRFAKPVVIDTNTLALDVIQGNKSGLIAHEHTALHMREELHTPRLVKSNSYEDWWSQNGPDVVAQAKETVQNLLTKLEPPAMDSDIEKQLDSYVAKRRKVLQKVT